MKLKKLELDRLTKEELLVLFNQNLQDEISRQISTNARDAFLICVLNIVNDRVRFQLEL